MNYKVFFIWLTFVIIWNYGYPSVTPFDDVVVAVVLSLGARYLTTKLEEKR
tara:strand:+ start:229 stop:381 length:153 start_codon:yes stop_codon:yes gene_type:complete